METDYARTTHKSNRKIGKTDKIDTLKTHTMYIHAHSFSLIDTDISIKKSDGRKLVFMGLVK